MGKKSKGGWTVETLYLHNKELRKADIRFNTEQDRRYSEGASLRAEALAIEKNSTSKALDLARESQAYKEQQADAMRDKTLGESGLYATSANVSAGLRELEETFFKALNKLVIDLKPLTDFVAQQKGASALTTKQLAWFGVAVALVVGVIKYLGN